jgi:hypothetical protein
LNPKSSSKDIFGLALESFYTRQDKTPIKVHNEDFYDDEIPVEYLFRSYQEMPKLEQIALDLFEGKILDVGCCAGSHSLELKARGLEVLPIDISPISIKVCYKRGLKKAKCLDFFELNNEKFDTILLLMNGIGIAKSIDNLNFFFENLKSLMHPNSQVLLDSSDLIFLHENELTETDNYYGQMTYKISYKKSISDSFQWLYLDFNLLNKKASKRGFLCELVFEDEHFGFLAKLKLN